MRQAPTGHPGGSLMRRLALVGSLVLAVSSALASLSAERPAIAVTVEDDAPLARTLRVSFRTPTPVDVEYWALDGPRLVVTSRAARDHAIPLVRLRPDRLYQFQVRETGTRGTFRTGPLPSDLAAVTFAATGTPTTPLALVHLFNEDGFKGYVIVDAKGEVVWYWRTRNYPFGAARRANGNFVFMDKGRGIVDVAPTGIVMRELPQQDAEREMHHDLITTPADTVLYLAFDTETFQGARVKGEAIWEWNPDTGDHVKRWRSWDHLTPALDRGPRFGGEWMHANALAIGPRGNILVSVHYFNQILSLSPDWRSIEWRLGGVRATTAVPTGEEFSGQHTAHEVEHGRVLLFDNDRDRGKRSRAVEFRLDGAIASKVWEWSPARANYAAAVSGVRRLANGNTLVSFGMSAGRNESSGPTEAYEVTAAGDVVWHLTVSGTTTMFRVEPVASIAGEAPRAARGR
jgi:hypothetical protein